MRRYVPKQILAMAAPVQNPEDFTFPLCANRAPLSSPKTSVSAHVRVLKQILRHLPTRSPTGVMHGPASRPHSQKRFRNICLTLIFRLPRAASREGVPPPRSVRPPSSPRATKCRAFSPSITCARRPCARWGQQGAGIPPAARPGWGNPVLFRARLRRGGGGVPTTPLASVVLTTPLPAYL